MRITTLAAVVTMSVGCSDPIIYLEDANNYDYVGVIDMPRVETASGADLSLDWSGLTQDLRCHDVSPSQVINNLGLIRFPDLTEEEIEDRISTDSLLQSDTSGATELAPDGITRADLSAFSFSGTAIDVAEEYTDEDGLFLLTLSAGGELGIDTRMLALLDPEPSSSNTTVSIEGGCDVLDFSTDLSALQRLSAPAEADSWIVDWSRLTQTGLDNELVFGSVDGVLIGFYEGLSVSDIETQFLDLELIASALYEIPLESGVGAELTDARTADGRSFSGFTGDGIWLVGLTCASCANPAPLFLTIIEPQ
ncbi:MAG: hypothetical protein AAFV53_31575 [Myxococcota bacterium]